MPSGRPSWTEKSHSDVLKFCRAELVADNYFHAVFEAAKSVAEKLREKTGLLSDGAVPVDEALGLGKAGVPRLAFNSCARRASGASIRV